MPIQVFILNGANLLHKMKKVDASSIKKKTIIDQIVKIVFLAITILCASVIIFIVSFILIKGITPFVHRYEIDGQFYSVNFFRFLGGTTWYQYPNLYSIGFIVINTIYVTFLSLLIAVPISVLTALFISKIAPKKIGKFLNTIIEILASIPSIIYGLFGVGVITLLVKDTASLFHYQSAGGVSTLASVLVLAMMIIPTITMLSITAIQSVKDDLIKGSLALGASQTQTNFKLVLTSAKSGIFSGIILGVGRALGEATAVSMVAGNADVGPTFNLFDTTRTLTTTMLQGFQETTGLNYDIRFSVGVVLIVIILGTNIILNIAKKKIGRGVLE